VRVTEPTEVVCAGTGDDADLAGALSAAEDGLRASAAAGPPLAATEDADCLLAGPGVSGGLSDLLARAGERHPDLPVVALTDDPEAALAAGAAAVAAPEESAAVLANRVRTVVERDRARASADRTERRLGSLLQGSPDRLSVLDSEGRYAYVSPAVERLMGHDREALEGSSGLEYVHPEDRERVQELLAVVVEAPNGEASAEYRVRDADGAYRWVESRATNRLEDPAVEGVVLNSREISDRKERERALAEERALTRSVFAGLPDALYAFDEEGQFLRWNDRFAEVTGYADAEIADMHPVEFIAEPDRPAVAEAIADVFENGSSVTVEARFETKSGERLPYEFTGARMTDGGAVLGLVGIGRDVADRKRRQRRFEAVFDNTYQFTGLMEPDGTLIEANRTALEFAGIDREDAVGEKLWDSHWFQSNEAAREAAREAVATAREGELYRTELTVQGDGETETIDFSVRPIRDEHGAVRLLIPEGRAITELKRRERHLGVLHRFLRHNLRNKMTVIEGTADHLASLLDAPYDEHVEQIRGAAAELVALSETAHTLSRTAVESDDERYPVAPGRVLEEVAATLRERYPSASIAVEADADARVSADWRLEAVFEQLAENAVEHAGHDSPTVVLSVDAGEERVAVRVADDGPGIPETELASLTDEAPTQLTHGTGFGLWLVRSVVADYGGELRYDTPPDGGSVFTVRLRRPPDEGSPVGSADEAGS